MYHFFAEVALFYYINTKIKTNFLLFTGDLKLYWKNKKELKSLIKPVQIILQDIGMGKCKLKHSNELKMPG